MNETFLTLNNTKAWSFVNNIIIANDYKIIFIAKVPHTPALNKSAHIGCSIVKVLSG